MAESITPEQRDRELQEWFDRLMNAPTRNQREKIVEQMLKVIRTPTETLFVEGL